MDDTSITIIAIIALLVSVVAGGYTYINSIDEVTDSDLDKAKFDSAQNKLALNSINNVLVGLSNDIENIDVDCECSIDEDDLEDIEDDVDDLQDDVDDLNYGYVEECYEDNTNWTAFKNCLY